nr:glucarate dehydratase [Chloroflexia bacterium]
MRVTPVAMADPPLLSSYGLHAPYALRTVVELVSDDGITGAAETHGGERTLEQFERARERVIGRDPYDLAHLHHELDAMFGASAPLPATASGTTLPQQTLVLPGESASDIALRIFGALEVAALDLIGKATGRPVCDLLGGRIRDAVPFSAYLFYKRAGGGGAGSDARADAWGEVMTPEAVVAEARQMIDTYGFGSIKLKGGVLPPDEEIAAMEALHDALGPSVPLRIDPNCAWTVDTSVRVGRKLAGTLEYLEDPTAGLAGMTAVRQALLGFGIETPLASNNAVTAFADLPAVVRGDSAQVILADHHYWGGLRAATHLGQLCQAFGLGLSMHSNSHLGLSLLAMVHFAAATPHLTYASDTHYPWQDATDEILEGGRVTFVDGSVPVPAAPGLGAELDRDALARGRERYEACGYRSRDDEAEMRRHVDPNWRRTLPRW